MNGRKLHILEKSGNCPNKDVIFQLYSRYTINAKHGSSESKSTSAVEKKPVLFYQNYRKKSKVK